MNVKIKMYGVKNRPILLVAFLLLGVFFVWQGVGPVTSSILGEKKHVEAAGEPLTIDAPVTFTSTSNLTVPKVIDAANSAYFLDPAATGDSLVAAGKVTAGSFAGDGSLLTGISGIPAGLVSFFNLASCPTGWTDLTATYGGRYMVAKPTGGTLAGTVGTALTDLQNLTHTHSFTPAGSVSSSFTGSAGTTGSGGVDHTHTGPSHTHTESSASHSHTVTVYDDSSGLGARNPGTTGASTGGTSGTGASGTGATGGASAFSHTHAFTPAGSVSSTFTGSGGTSGANAGTNAPYIQLLACQKS